MTPALLEQTVLSKPYFDRQGLVLAFDDEGPVGFIHTSVCPATDETNDFGLISIVMVASRADSNKVGSELLADAEQRFQEKGVHRIVVGELPPQNPFYLGLYGGSNSPGILASDSDWISVVASQGFEPCARRVVLQRSLAGFRPVIDRKTMQIRRQFAVTSEPDPATSDWREACTVGQTNRIQFVLSSREEQSVANVCFWDMEPLASSWGTHTAGILEIAVAESCRRQGMATFLLGESLRKLQTQGITLVEVQVPAENAAALSLFAKLGFDQIDEGIQLAKTLDQ